MTGQKQKRNERAHDGQNLTNTMNIQSDIPIPDIKVKHCPHIERFQQLLSVMQVGDSFIADQEIITRSGGIKYQKTFEAKYNLQLTHRKTAEGIRIWRIA